MEPRFSDLFKGWLLLWNLFCFVFLLELIWRIVELYHIAPGMSFEPGTLEAVYKNKIIMHYTFRHISRFVMLISLVVLGCIFFSLSAAFPWVARLFLMVAMVWITIDILGGRRGPPIELISTHGKLWRYMDLGIHLSLFFAWYSYFKKSKRVREIFSPQSNYDISS